ncbi:MAG: hypothetical protein ACTSWV_02155 [Candidatus Asgardarchaeia archaeon]
MQTTRQFCLKDEVLEVAHALKSPMGWGSVSPQPADVGIGVKPS